MRARLRVRAMADDGLLGGMAVQLLGRVGGLGLQVATLAMMTRWLGVGRFGDFAAGLATVSVLEAVAEFGFTATIVVRLGEGLDRRRVLAAAVVATVVTAVGALAVTVPIAVFVLSRRAQVAALLLAPSSLLGVLTITSIAYWTHRLSFRRIVAASAGGQALGLAAIAVLFASGRHWGETQQLLGIGGGFALSACVTFAALVPPGAWRLHRVRDAQPSLADVRTLLAGALPLGIAASMSMIHVRSDQFVLAAFGYRQGLAEYAVAYRVLEGVVAGIAPLAFVTFGHMSRTRGAARLAYARRGGAVLCAVGCWAALATVLFSNLAIFVLAGNPFAGAVGPCRLLAPVILVSAMNALPARVLIIEGRSGVLARISAAGIVCNIALNILLIPHLGIRGAATATLVSETLGLAASVVLAERAIPGSQPIPVLVIASVGTILTALVAGWRPAAALEVALPVGVLTGVLVGAGGVLSYRAARPTRTDPPDVAGARPDGVAALGSGQA